MNEPSNSETNEDNSNKIGAHSEDAMTQEPLIQYAAEGAFQTQQVTFPPPPYFEPLPQLRPNYDHSHSAIYLSPLSSLQIGAQPTRLRCPNCSADILTKINYKSGCMTWSIAGSICAIGLFAPCAWLGSRFLLNSQKPLNDLSSKGYDSDK